MFEHERDNNGLGAASPSNRVFLWWVSDGTRGQMPREARGFVFLFLFWAFCIVYTTGRLSQYQLVRTQTAGQGEMVSRITAGASLFWQLGEGESLATCAGEEEEEEMWK